MNNLPSWLFKTPWVWLIDGKGCWQDVCEYFFCYDEPDAPVRVRVARNWYGVDIYPGIPRDSARGAMMKNRGIHTNQ